MKNVMIGDVLNRALATPIGMYFTDPRYMRTVVALASDLLMMALNTIMNENVPTGSRVWMLVLLYIR